MTTQRWNRPLPVAADFLSAGRGKSERFKYEQIWDALLVGNVDQRLVGPPNLRKSMVVDLCRRRLVLKQEIRAKLAQIENYPVLTSRFRISGGLISGLSQYSRTRWY